MRRRTLFVYSLWTLLAVVVSAGEPGQQLSLTTGMVIDRAVTIRPGTYHLSSKDLDTPAIIIRGDNITVDFNGAVLAGGRNDADPDSYAGTGILIDGGSKVTLKNAIVRGYKVGIRARNSPDLHLTRNDVSYNWKQRLYSQIDKESLVDWMSYHQNEKDEWLRYGAGIYLRECDRAEIDHTIAVHGQNGLMVTHSNGLKIWNNTFQFLSSIGIGLYRVSHSTIMHNRIDWCVRGYSHGFYNRGQDSAGLLMYEQSSNNTVAYNSVTHGGDGLFLWAGQSTMDTGKGGANDNLFYGNDFSHAPTNGIEATFSRNKFIENRVEENWHGVWGGYSYDSQWIDNHFSRNTEGMAIEHGQDNVILGNTFEGDETAIRLWQNATQDPSWGYAKSRDTRSRNYRIDLNEFVRNKVAVDVRDSADVKLFANRFIDPAERLRLTGLNPGFSDLKYGDVHVIPLTDDPTPPARLSGGVDPMILKGQRRGRNTIIVDEWGPYDWKQPRLWPDLGALKAAGGASVLAWTKPMKFNVLGPDGTWKVTAVRGATVAPATGKVGDTITVTPVAPHRATRPTAVDYDIRLEYRGGEVTSPRGERTPAGKPYTFTYSRFFAPIDWTINFFEYTDDSDPVKQPDAFATFLSRPPLKTVKSDRLDYMSGRAVEEGVPRDRFAFSAGGVVTLPAGDYTLQVISDDGVRVWADGKVILDAWEPHESRVDRVDLRGGTRKLRVDYYEAGGWAEMRLDILPRRTRK
jgi:nitrous oxidase accessory protein NosD